MTQPDLLQRVLARLILRHPFLATLALRLERVEDPKTPTAWTDGVRLGVNPTWFAELEDERRIALLAHECYHVALGHHLRRGGRDFERWNRACDFAVNALLLEDGFTLFPGALYDPAYADASAEAIYNRLPPPPAANTGCDGSADTPLPAGDGSTPSAGAGATPPGGHSSLPSPDLPAEPAPPSGDAATFGEVRDQPFPTPPTPAQQQTRLAEHAVLMTALAQQARAAGKDSAGARRAAAAAAQPATVDWRALLVEFLTARNAQDYTWRRPNPRYAVLGLFLPLLESAALGSVAFVIDTSGSVPKSALDAVTAELEAYLLQYPTTTLEVLYADARVTDRASYTAADLPLRLTPIGGGGTDFRPALATLAEADEPPACVVYLTDLEGTFPEEPPPMPVIWLVFGQPLTLPSAPFGRVVPLPY
jgi:predicted metal-dependent peptidase